METWSRSNLRGGDSAPGGRGVLRRSLHGNFLTILVVGAALFLAHATSLQSAPGSRNRSSAPQFQTSRELLLDAVGAPEFATRREADLCRWDPQIRCSRLVHPATDAFSLDAPASFSTFDGQRFFLRFDRKIRRETGGDVWIGRAEGSLCSDATFSVRNGVVVGAVCIPGHGVFTLRPIGAGIHALQQIDGPRF